MRGLVQWWIKWSKEIFTFIAVVWVFVISQMLAGWPM